MATLPPMPFFREVLVSLNVRFMHVNGACSFELVYDSFKLSLVTQAS